MTEQDFKANQIWTVQQAVKWACERQSILLKKKAGLPKPWTDDPLLMGYRFCNVSRQDDRETIELNEKFYKPGIEQYGIQDLWFNVAIARWINWSPTVIGIGWTDLTNGYDADDLLRRMKALEYSDKFFTGAYMIRGCGNVQEVDGDEELYEKCKDKRFFLTHVVFPAILKVGPPAPGETLEAYHSRLTKAKSNGPFMAGQQIADLKYFNMREASDWTSWAPWGPGPARFLNRMNSRPLTKQIPISQYYAELKEFDVMLQKELDAYDFDPEIKAQVVRLLFDAHDRNSNLLCETDKYIRLQQGGQVRSKYNGQSDKKVSTTHTLF